MFNSMCLETWQHSVFLFNFRMYRLFFHQIYLGFPCGNRCMPAFNKEPYLLHQRTGNRNEDTVNTQLAHRPWPFHAVIIVGSFCSLVLVRCCSKHSTYCFIHFLECLTGNQFHSPDCLDQGNESIGICISGPGYSSLGKVGQRF